MKQTALFDSSVWIAIFKGKRINLSSYRGLQKAVSTIVLYEVYRKYLEEDPAFADVLVDEIRAHSEVIDVTPDIALRAAKLRQKYRFSMADAIILSTAIERKAKLITSDPDFKPVTEVQVEIV